MSQSIYPDRAATCRLHVPRVYPASASVVRRNLSRSGTRQSILLEPSPQKQLREDYYSSVSPATVLERLRGVYTQVHPPPVGIRHSTPVTIERGKESMDVMRLASPRWVSHMVQVLRPLPAVPTSTVLVDSSIRTDPSLKHVRRQDTGSMDCSPLASTINGTAIGPSAETSVCMNSSRWVIDGSRE